MKKQLLLFLILLNYSFNLAAQPLTLKDVKHEFRYKCGKNDKSLFVNLRIKKYIRKFTNNK